jgi:hypothetical protein
VNALRVPLYDLLSNWAYMLIAALAWNIKSWFAMMLHRHSDRRVNRHGVSPLLDQHHPHPAMIIHRARSITVRLIGYNPSLGRLFSTWNTIERTRFG